MYATLFTLLICWAVLSMWWFTNGEGQLYLWLLSVSAFTGAICWISICWAQIIFRKRVYERGYTNADIISPAPLSPWIPGIIGIILQVFALIILAFNTDLQGSLYLSIPAVLLPMVIYYLGIKAGYFKGIKVLEPEEKLFDELFPDKKGIKE